MKKTFNYKQKRLPDQGEKGVKVGLKAVILAPYDHTLLRPVAVPVFDHDMYINPGPFLIRTGKMKLARLYRVRLLHDRVFFHIYILIVIERLCKAGAALYQTVQTVTTVPTVATVATAVTADTVFLRRFHQLLLFYLKLFQHFKIFFRLSFFDFALKLPQQDPASVICKVLQTVV